MTTRVIGYIRASTEEQTITLDAQRAKLVAYAAALDLELVAIVEDGGSSAKTLRRPKLQSALARLDVGDADAILVTKLDRLTRSVRDLGTLLESHFGERRPFALLSVGDSIDTRTAAGRLVLNVLASVAQWEREAIGERTRDALAQVKCAGGRVGRSRLGERRLDALDEQGRRLLAVEGEGVRALARARSLRAEGRGFAAIAEQLAAEGFPTARGGRWQGETVRKALAREAA